VLTILTAYPARAWLVLVAAPSFDKMLLVEFWLSILYACHGGAMVVTLTEIIPVELRTGGFSMAQGLSASLFGSFTPAVSTLLIQATGNKAAPSRASFVAICSLIATMLIYLRAAAQSASAARLATGARLVAVVLKRVDRGDG